MFQFSPTQGSSAAGSKRSGSHLQANSDTDEFTGRLEAVHTVEVRPRVSGYLQSVHFKEGEIVRQGDLLFQIDARPFQAEVDRLKGELAQAKAQAFASAKRFRARRAPS